MDALALLCTLYADGPSTLQRLRSNGCDSLAVLLETPADELERRMEWNERMSQRFLKEACSLAERLDEGWSDETTEEGIPGRPSELSEASDAEVERPVEASHPTPSSPRVGGGQAALLDHWRALDKEHPPKSLESAPVASGLPVERAADDTRLFDLGLSRAQVARLQSVGVQSLEAFVDAEPLELATLLQLPYTRAHRYQLMGRRTVAQVEPREEARPSGSAALPGDVDTFASVSLASARTQAAEREAAEGEDRTLDAAGPFA